MKELYYYEIEQNRLNFDADPGYQNKLAAALAERQEQELSPALFSLLNTANQISFTHGFRLRLSLAQWANAARFAEAALRRPTCGGAVRAAD